MGGREGGREANRPIRIDTAGSGRPPALEAPCRLSMVVRASRPPAAGLPPRPGGGGLLRTESSCATGPQPTMRAGRVPWAAGRT